MNAPTYYVMDRYGHYVRAQRQPIAPGDLRCALLLAFREFIGDEPPGAANTAGIDYPTRPKLPDSSIDARTSLTGVFDNTPN